MKNILFVDDEEKVLDGLRRMLYSLRQEWDMGFVQSAAEALEALKKKEYDVVVSDMRMPGTDGAELLEIVKQQYPHTIRIILSGFSEKELIMKSVRPSHQFLTKPIDANNLKKVIDRAIRLHAILRSEKIKDVISRLENLPSMPEIYTKIMSLLASPDTSIKDIALLVKKDMGMTAQVLKLVNSSYFGFYKKITDPVEAAVLLGMNTLKTLALSYNIFSRIPDVHYEGFSYHHLWEHSTLSAVIARDIMRQVSMDEHDVDDAFTAGFLHDIGFLILASTIPKTYREILELSEKEGIPIWTAETRILGANHAEIGAYLLGLWGFDDNLVHAILHHHKPFEYDEGGSSLTSILHVSDVLSRQHVCVEGPMAYHIPEEKFRPNGPFHGEFLRWKKIADLRTENDN